MNAPPNLHQLSFAQLLELVGTLLSHVTELELANSALCTQITRLKGPTTIKPSGMEQATDPAKPALHETRQSRGKITPRVCIEDRVLALLMIVTRRLTVRSINVS